MRNGRRPAAEGGFTYFGVLLIVLLIGLALAQAGEVASTTAKRERERELLFVGRQYRDAIGRFYAQQHRFPATLEDLLGVETGGGPPARYLRQLYREPMQPNVGWTLIPAQQGGIQGVASASQDRPLQVAGFEFEELAFDDATSYADWSFVFDPRRYAVPGRVGPAAVRRP